jgi:hypothetical protein
MSEGQNQNKSLPDGTPPVRTAAGAGVRAAAFWLRSADDGGRRDKAAQLVEVVWERVCHLKAFCVI